MKVKQALTSATCFCREAYRWVSRGIASIRPDELIAAVVTRAQGLAGGAIGWGSGKGNRRGVEMTNEPTEIAQMLRTFDTFEAAHGRPPHNSDELGAFLERSEGVGTLAKSAPL